MKSMLNKKPEDLAILLKFTGIQDRIYYKTYLEYNPSLPSHSLSFFSLQLLVSLCLCCP